MSFNDVEYLVLFALMAVFFLTGLRKRDNAIEGRFAGIVLPMSTALKGIACVLILMGHFASRMIDMGQATIPTRLVYLTTANVALALFMYFSGYGLSVKKSNGGGVFLYMVSKTQKSISAVTDNLCDSYGFICHTAR